MDDTSARTTTTAASSGTYKLSGKTEVRRLGFGTMQLTGKGVWGEPEDQDNAHRVLSHVRDLGITFVDTADSYGPEVAERLVRETLYPYNGILVATKGGLTRPGPDVWVPNGRPEYLRSTVLASMKRLGLSMLPLWQLHRVDPKVPRDEQFGAIAEMRAEGLIEHIGLSQVTVDDIRAAEEFFKVATVQNLYNLTNRASEDVLDYCEQEHIGFIPWYPLANGKLAAPGSKLSAVAAKHQATPAQIALAWLLRRSPVMLPIPGTASLAHLEDNTAAARIVLDDQDMKTLNGLAT